MEKTRATEGGDLSPALPPPTPLEPSKYKIMSRSAVPNNGVGRIGRPIPLLTNHFKVSLRTLDAVFYKYTVTICGEDKRSVEGKEISRKILDELYQTYSAELADKKFAYDGEKSLYTVGALPRNKLEFTVVLEDSRPKHENGSSSSGDKDKRSKASIGSKTFLVAISYSAKIPMQSIALALQGKEVESGTQDALRVLDIALRQQAASRGCLVRQSFFHDDPTQYFDVGGDVTGVKGFHSSFRPTQGGLSLNMDVSATLILRPGPVIDFLKDNQHVREPRDIDWIEAKRMLRNMRVKSLHRNMEYKIIGLSEKPCNKQLFTMKVRNGNSANDAETTEITVYDYFAYHWGIELRSSADFPCLDVGKPKRPIYLPLELCTLVSLQECTKSPSSTQRASLVEKSRPQERMRTLTDAVRNYRYDEDPVISAFGVSIERQLTEVDGRVLVTPEVKVGNNDNCIPCNGRWNFNNKRLLKPITLEGWMVVNFSSPWDTSCLSKELIKSGKRKGIEIATPLVLMEEDQQFRQGSPADRVEMMMKLLEAKFPDPPKFILCILPGRKKSDIYGQWKKICLIDKGIPTQCISPTRIDDQYLTNVLLKINTKLGGINSLLVLEDSKKIPQISGTPTLILGMNVSPGRSDIPSMAAVVGSRCWPLISRYRASVRTQSSKLDMIDALYKPVENGSDDKGIIRELLMEFYKTSNRKPEQIIVFRDGVSESQFNRVLNIELDQIVKAFQLLWGPDIPKFTVIVAQKNHHTKLFQANATDNIPPGTVVDSKIVHPRNFDFYMCAQTGLIGTSRPAHYHVLVDEIGFTPENLQDLIHSLSYVYQKSTTAISIVAPIRYAHLAAAQMGRFIKLEDLSETSSESILAVGSTSVPKLPKLHEDVASSMFFC